MSASELEVMKVLWKDHPQTAAQVIAALAPLDWSESTVKTLLARLVKKGWLAAESEKNRFSYRPLADQAAFGEDRGRELARSLTGGPAFPVMLQFLKTAELSPAEIAQLRQVLEGRSDD